MENHVFRQDEAVAIRFKAEPSPRAIYFDYEGIYKSEPILLGWLNSSGYGGAVVDERFRSCAGKRGAKRITYLSHKSAVEALVGQARAEDLILSAGVNTIPISPGLNLKEH